MRAESGVFIGQWECLIVGAVIVYHSPGASPHLIIGCRDWSKMAAPAPVWPRLPQMSDRTLLPSLGGSVGLQTNIKTSQHQHCNIVTFGLFLIGIFSLTLRSQKEGWTVRCDMRCDVRCGVVEVEGLQPVDCRRTHDTVTSYVLPVICLFTLCSLFALISRRNCCVQCDAGLQPTRVNVTAT